MLDRIRDLIVYKLMMVLLYSIGTVLLLLVTLFLWAPPVALLVWVFRRCL